MSSVGESREDTSSIVRAVSSVEAGFGLETTRSSVAKDEFGSSSIVAGDNANAFNVIE